MAPKFGPVELIAIGFPQDRIPDDVKSELLALVESQQVRIVDLVVARRGLEGDVEIIEVDQLGDELEITDVQLAGGGLTSEEDVDEVVGALEPGTSALVLVVEHLWSVGLQRAIFAAGGELLASERIPADVVDELSELADELED
ncbi:DUF6325 family protein [Cellulomonas sp. HZM]|uniref:DUF6325 family protein n=1 Tax=Cellulomonas sp. HZM TaxID=1454010 RepID=UPI0004937CCC|nr:DUF6325 family protein [Cellulomonas sp. HZM]